MNTLCVALVVAIICACCSAASLVDASSSILVGAVQVFPEAGITPKDKQLATANNLVNVLVDATRKYGSYALLNTPEFLFNGGVEYAAAGSCSGKGTNTSGTLAGFCTPVPQKGEKVDCSNSKATPLAMVACQLLKRGSMFNQTSVSINVCEVVANGTLYNTQVIVHIGKMQVLAKYRKFHPFFTNCFSKPTMELVTFDIQAFKFGVFTCFDILFSTPKMNLVHMGIQYFSYSMSMPGVGEDAVKLFSFENKVAVVNSNAAATQTGVIVDGKQISPRCPKEKVAFVSTATLNY